MNSVLLQIDLSPLNKYECGGKQTLFISFSTIVSSPARRYKPFSNASRREVWKRSILTLANLSLTYIKSSVPRIEKCNARSAALIMVRAYGCPDAVDRSKHFYLNTHRMTFCKGVKFLKKLALRRWKSITG